MVLSIIIVHFNQTKFFSQCLTSLKEAKIDFPFEIIIIDNNSQEIKGSSEETNKFLKSTINKIFPQAFEPGANPSIKFIQNKKNLGLSKAVNQGLKIAKGRYALYLNSDILVLPNSIETLISFLDKHPKVGLVGPALFYPDNRLQYSAYRQASLLVSIIKRTFLQKTKWGKKKLDYFFLKDKDLSQPLPAVWILGAVLMVRMSAVKEVGPMNEKFFLYFEDTEWAYRFWQKGWQVYYLPQAKMIHFYQRESAKKNLFLSLFSKIFWIHLSSAFKFYLNFRK